MAKKGKKYVEAKKLLESKEFFNLDEAVELLPKTSTTKFDASCEMHLNLGVDPKQADQNLRTTVMLPHGNGKKLKIVAFVSEDKVAEAKSAGAAEAGTADLVAKIEKGWTDFDVAVATPDQMKNIGKIAKTLGQKGLMPSPKAGTLTPEFEKTIKELNQGKVEIRVDKHGNVHVMFGKVSFGDAKLKENAETVISKILEIKPGTVKGTYIRSMTLTTAMGPGVHLNVNEVVNNLS